MALKASDVLIESFDFVEGFFDKVPPIEEVIFAVRIRAVCGGKVHSREG